jgi:O-antigen ligase
LLCLVALAAIAWSDATPIDQFGSFKVFARLLVIALLFIQFRHSEFGVWVIGGFLLSCAVLLVFSWALWLFPGLGWRQNFPGVPVRDYIIQSGEFLICVFALGHLALDAWRRGDRRRAIALGLLASLFLANIGYVASARSTLVAVVVLALLFVVQRLGWKQGVSFATLAGIVASLIWMSSPYLRARVLGVVQEIQHYQAKGAATSSGYRLDFWTRSIAVVAQAPIVGHGTGSQREQFQRSATGSKGIAAIVTDNPHNQVLHVAIQFGALGTVLLFAMWFAHLLLFRGDSWPGRIGAGLVVQNIVAGIFNTSLVEFTHAWMYIFGVGVLGGMILRAGPNSAKDHAG